MAFLQSSKAQDIINKYLTNYNYPQQADMNANNVFRNPYSPAGFYANDTDASPKPAFVPPTTDENGTPQCDNANGYYYDTVTQSCKLIETPSNNNNNANNNNNGGGAEATGNSVFDTMAKDVTQPFGASNELQKYFNESMSNASVNGDKYYDFKGNLNLGIPSPILNMLASGVDSLFGGPAKRQNRFNTAVNTILGQTTNPFSFGEMMGDSRFRVYGPQTYLNRVGNLPVTSNQGTASVNDLLASMQKAEEERGKTQGSPIAQDNSGATVTGTPLRNADGTRNDVAYQSAVAKNIARNIANTGTSGFSTSLGGFTRGR